jgi:hypothetical protein
MSKRPNEFGSFSATKWVLWRRLEISDDRSDEDVVPLSLGNGVTSPNQA